VHPDSLEMVKGLTRELAQGRERRNRMLSRNNTKDGRVIWCQWYNSAVYDDNGKLTSILSLAEDVTARMDAEEQLRQAAVHDALTGLPNRNSLAARLEHAILRVNRSGDRLALLFIDLDKFKKVNDTLGHTAATRCFDRRPRASAPACARSTRWRAWAATNSWCCWRPMSAPIRPASSASASRPPSAPPSTGRGWKCAVAPASA
jgi:hypothetical protein